MSDQPKPCIHGRRFCMDCHYQGFKKALAPENQRVVPAESLLASRHPFDRPSLLRDCNVSYSNSSSSRHLAGQGERQEAVPEETPHIIVFDDADRPDEKFSGAGARPAALRRWEQISVSWNAHLFVRVERNSRDDPYPCARLASQVNRIPAGLYAELEALRTLRDATGVYLQGYMRDEIEDEDNCVTEDQHDAACSVKSALDNARALEWKGGGQ